MFFIPGSFISLVTFPGVIVHEIAHRFFADISKVPVYQVCYLQLDNSIGGFVTCAPAKNLLQAFLISLGPLILNTILCALLTFTAYFPFYILKTTDHHWIFNVLIWLGLSIGMHAIPSSTDVKSFEDSMNNFKINKVLCISLQIIVVLPLKGASLLKFFWFDLIYAVGVAYLLPYSLGYV